MGSGTTAQVDKKRGQQDRPELGDKELSEEGEQETFGMRGHGSGWGDTLAPGGDGHTAEPMDQGHSHEVI